MYKIIGICKKEWIEICNKYSKWCSFEEVERCSYEEAEEYIKNMPTLIPM